MSTAQHSTAQHSTAQHSTAQHSTAQHSTAQQKLGDYTQVEKLDLTSKDILSDNIAKIGQLFPEVLTESSDENGRSRPAIDFDKLRQFLSREIVEGRESYEFTWVGKRGAIAEAGKPTTQTLRPDLEESVDFDKSENVFITGDNLEVLKVLQESYLGKIDMIYIDPPYNTGKDFVYSDKFQMSEEELADEMDLRDEDGLQRVGLTKNEKSSARYHSDWLNMMYPRLVLARNLLKDSGVIFISIDDNEQANLKAICDEIFGEENFVADVIWERAYSPVNLKKHFSESHDYILVYAKNIEFAINHGIPRSAEANSRYQNIDNDPRGVWKSSDLSVGPAVPSNIYEITTPSGRKVLPPSGYSWRLNKERFEEFIADNRIWFGSNGDNVPSIKRFLSEVKNTVTPMTIWKYADVGHSQSASQDLKKIFDGKAYFTYPKPVPLMKQIVQLYSEKDGLILDFFAGSATTADAVMQLNAEDGGNRKYILCTLDEQVADKSAAKEAGYETIDQISRERIRRAAKKIQEEHPATVGKQDFGFRAYKLDSSNFKEVSQTPDSFSQESLFDSVSNIKDGRTDLDLLFQIMLTWGMELSLPIAKTQIDGIAVYNVADGALIACFADEISESVLRQIAKEEPLRAVFKDESFTNSAAKINLGQIFKEEAPGTKVKVV
ncbi:site-specific DNA-methyltransferase [Streptococcus suis]|uniref:site-specific DNA-methyltransferase n=1 Tax=Streptococcus suis TaxID=1307 RepID=UPI002117A57A|nr:site-specific DNA-methyltransferase [Streptococcus suis]MCQ8785284.1 site-specific DNA-methyltransferase [Streptococcus suis]WQE86341.1 site-specific DNA-methyltransferase [Streptococcus suis]